MTQELPKKHKEAGPPEQLPSDALSQFYNGHTRHWRLPVPTNNAKGILKICVWLSGRLSPPPRFKTLRRLCCMNQFCHLSHSNMDTSWTEKPFLTLVVRFRCCESFLNGICINIPYMTYLPKILCPRLCPLSPVSRQGPVSRKSR